ncbi:NtaA/DmoA family FMN-dependent monooxygenase [Acrocarpospora catenulata]|uniref:NtaA/DmoA family FMN-dependent monooxygenase n=1 Tax=Acrocarpospora catenulata TaxID=2836182 RepID=UPI001BDA487D|nr:NtaA/DmoA family FMN-dependent monooxygenase [Acrocarpospora catenulata]
MSEKKHAHLVALTHSTGSHLRGWRHPNTPARPATDVKAFVEVAQELERGFFDALFLSETTGVMPGPPEMHQYDSMVNESLDPTLLLSAIAAATEHLGLITTASTSLTQPYTLARLLGSLDHLSDGRAGWNVVTSRFETEARNFGIDPRQLRSPVRYEVASEFVDIVKRLWDSGDDVLAPRGASAQAREATQAQLVDHRGTHFRVTGALGLARPPQGHPVILQAGMSEDGRELTAREADLALGPGGGLQAREARQDLRRRAAAFGRDPDSILVLAVLPPVLVAETRVEAEAQLREFAELLGPVERQNPGVIAGPAIGLADIMESWLDEGAADGFVVPFPYLQGPVAAFTRLVIPELQKRGRFRTAYAGRTLRENLGLPRPAPRNRPTTTP